MGEFVIMLRNVLIFVALAIPGYILVKGKLLRPEQSGVLSKLLMYLALPFMIFSGVIKNLTFNRESLLLLGVVAVIGIVVILGMFFVSAPLTKTSRCAFITSTFFFPIARRRISAPPSEYPAIMREASITCS